MRLTKKIISSVLSLAFSSAVLAKSPANSLRPICGSYFFSEDHDTAFSDIEFSDNEKILICGAKTPGWVSIPDWQAIEVIKRLLNSQGFYQSTVLKAADKFIVTKGSRTYVEGIKFTGAPTRFHERRFLRAKNKVLNTAALDQIEAWTKRRLKAIGYACPDFKLSADPKSGIVAVAVSPSRQRTFGEVSRQNVEGVRSQALSRYDAFEQGDLYDGDLLELTSRRVLTSGLVDYTRLVHDCLDNEEKTPNDSNAIALKQQLNFGKPQRLAIALGASTEELPIAKLSYTHSRLDRNGSNFTSLLYLSPVEQSITAESKFYRFDSLPRLYSTATLKSERQSENFFTTFKNEIGLGVGYHFDNSQNRYSIEVKPLYNIERTIKGDGPSSSKQLSLSSSIGVISHDFEFFQGDPRSGFQLGADVITQTSRFGADQSSSRYRFWGTGLANWGGYDPPLFVFGLRFGFAALETADISKTSTSLRLYLGGDDDVRGFSRKSINNNKMGYKTTAYLGTEMRFLNILPYKIQPFLLIDLAKTGTETYDFDQVLYFSSGSGIRWASPIGSIRATSAYGQKIKSTKDDSKRSRWSFFLSLGQEF